MRTAYQMLNDFNGHNSDCLLTGAEVIKLMQTYGNYKLEKAAELATTKTVKKLIKDHVLNPLYKSEGIRINVTVVDKDSILNLKDQF